MGALQIELVLCVWLSDLSASEKVHEDELGAKVVAVAQC